MAKCPFPYLRVYFGFGGKETKIGEEGSVSRRRYFKFLHSICDVIKNSSGEIKVATIALSAEHVGFFFGKMEAELVSLYSRAGNGRMLRSLQSD